MSTAGAAGAAACLTAMWQEEEEMTGYQPHDLNDGWEFKILRSATAAFRNPERLRAILEEERRAGWVLVEKFDDSRIRLKRPAGASQMDGKLDFDPYRSYVGVSQNKLALGIIGAFLGFWFLIFALAAILD